jgi:hypothetical protein
MRKTLVAYFRIQFDSIDYLCKQAMFKRINYTHSDIALTKYEIRFANPLTVTLTTTCCTFLPLTELTVYRVIFL